MNWRGRPLTSHEVIVETIAATTTGTGLTVDAELDTGSYRAGIKVTDREMKDLDCQPPAPRLPRRVELHPGSRDLTSVLFIGELLTAQTVGWIATGLRAGRPTPGSPVRTTMRQAGPAAT